VNVPSVAAVCIYPFLVKHARKLLADTPIKVASVATAFPSGQSPLRLRLAEVKQAVSDGADEVDMVINIGALKSGDLRAVERDGQGAMMAPTAQRNGTARKHWGPRASSTQISMIPWLDAMRNRIHRPAR